MWRIWAKALGEKHGVTNTEADKIAYIRTLLVTYTMITNTFIIIAALLSIIVNLKILHIL